MDRSPARGLALGAAILGPGSDLGRHRVPPRVYRDWNGFSRGVFEKEQANRVAASELRFDGGDHRRLPHILEHLASDPAIAQKLVGQFGTIGAALALSVASGGAFEEIRPAKCLVVDVRAEFDAVIADGAAQQIEEVAVVGLVQVGFGAASTLLGIYRGRQF